MLKKTISVLVLLLILVGCRSFYKETGTSITAGDVTAPLEVSDSSDIINIRALFSMTGMRIWAARGYDVYFSYNHAYTNSYLFGLVETKGVQDARGFVANTNSISKTSMSYDDIYGGKK